MKAVRKNDNRKLPRAEKEALRKVAVRRIQEQGISPEVIAREFDVNPRTVYRWIERYQSGGWDGLKNQAVPGRPSKLTDSQLAWLSKTLATDGPEQYKFPFALWTTKLIRELINRRLGVELSETSVGRLLKQIGFTAQRPLYSAWQQNPERVEHWLKEEFPALKAQAKKENALIFFGDESSVRSDYHRGTTWAPKGKTPVVKSSGSRVSLNMISAISTKGACRFKLHEGSMNADVFCDFLRRLTKNQERKIILVLDNSRVHHAKKVQRLVASMDNKLELRFLPPYSPELNPDELVWAHVKQKIGREVIEDKDHLRSRITGLFRSLQKTPNLVQSFFRTPTCSYTIA